MAKFVFSMQNLLDIKEKLEEQEKNNYRMASLRLQEAEDELERLQARQYEAEERLRQEFVSVMDIRNVRRRENAVEVIRMYVRQQQVVVIQCQKELEIARERLNEAMKERKTFDKLRERAFDEFMLEENKKEQKEVDELVSYRFGVAVQP